jgi:hypothetical protein
VAELNAIGHIAEMTAGEHSQYDVLVDEELVFSKQREQRWPELGEILAKLPSV